ncbi:hypothetical protein ACM3N2_17990 [Aeromonas hydrophila]|uniref:hypothetical protein n=1 Tax=Aeromonas hydrophila TaxID=644 RepID=UPI0039F68898
MKMLISLFVIIHFLSTAIAAEWNFNDPSKLASGEVTIPGITTLTASKSLSTSNVAITAGSYIGQVVSFVSDKATFLSTNGIDAGAFVFISDAVNGKIDITGSTLAKATGLNAVAADSVTKHLVTRHVYDGAYINCNTYPTNNCPATVKMNLSGLQDDQECQLHAPGVIFAVTYNSFASQQSNGVFKVTSVSKVNNDCVLSVKPGGSAVVSGTGNGNNGVPYAAAAAANPPVVDVVSSSFGGGDIAIRIN